jgi:hypothetical protein
LTAAARAGEPAGGKPAVAGEDFTSEAWSSLGRGGDWEIVSKNEIHQNDPDQPWKNNGFFRMLDQGGTMTYAFDVQVASQQGGAGLFVMGDEPRGVEHGDSYLVYYTEGKGTPRDGGQIRIGKFVDNKPDTVWSPKFDVSGTRGQWVSVRARYTAGTGEFVVWCNGREAGRATDKTPVAEGNHVAVHSFSTAARFRNLKIESARK